MGKSSFKCKDMFAESLMRSSHGFTVQSFLGSEMENSPSLLRRHDEHGAGGLFENLGGHAADEEIVDGSVMVGAEDDEVGGELGALAEDVGDRGGRELVDGGGDAVLG